MINEVKTAFKDNFKNLNWMDKETLVEAVKKADAITDMIGNRYIWERLLYFIFCTSDTERIYSSR